MTFILEQVNLRLNSACLRSDPTGLNSDHNFSFFWSYFQEPNSQFQFFRRILISNFHNLLKDLGIKFSAANIPIVCSLVLSQQLLAVKSWFAFYKTIVEIFSSEVPKISNGFCLNSTFYPIPMRVPNNKSSQCTTSRKSPNNF